MITTPQLLHIWAKEDTMTNKKEYYEAPKMEFFRFPDEDVITTSNKKEVAELEEIED